MKLNGHEYTQAEVFEALRKRGYLLLRYTYIEKDETFPGGIEEFTVETYCALRGGDLPSQKHLWENIALKEFQTTFVKPPLI